MTFSDSRAVSKVFSLPISDATPPTVSLITPTNFAHLAAGPSALIWPPRSRTNSSNVTLNLSVSGALTYSQNLTLRFDLPGMFR